MTSGRPWPSQTACNFEFKPPLVLPIRLGTAPLLRGWRRCDGPSSGWRRSSAGGRAAFGRERGEDLVEHAQPAPAHEPVVDRLVRTVFAWRVAPTQAVPDYEDDAADHPPVIDPRYPVRQWEIRLNPAHLRLRNPDQIAHGSASSHRQLNQTRAIL